MNFMKIIINESQFDLYKKFLLENQTDEGRNIINTKAGEAIRAKEDELRKQLFNPEELGTVNDKLTDTYQLNNYPVMNDIQLATGLFSVGNAKLSDDTLIINFTSALRCPSINLCPVTQMACYAVAGEIRLPQVRKKNLMVQEMWKRAIKNNKLGEVFGIAETYILVSRNTNKPIRYIRFNEVGDFLNQRILDAAALFAKEMREKYQVQSMAYTSNSRLDFKKEIDGISIYNIIKINASRLDIDLGNAGKTAFLAKSMDFESALAENDKVISIGLKELIDMRFDCEGVLNDPETNTPSIPVLNKGNWGTGAGWYYVCPCSFWAYKKIKATLALLREWGIVGKNVYYMEQKEINKILKKLSEEQLSKIKEATRPIKSPCGVQCAVCHNTSGGVAKEDSKYGPEHWHMIKDYTVLEAVHGSSSSKYKSKYADEKRKGNDNVRYSRNNKWGAVRKFTKPKKKVK